MRGKQILSSHLNFRTCGRYDTKKQTNKQDTYPSTNVLLANRIQCSHNTLRASFGTGICLRKDMSKNELAPATLKEPLNMNSNKNE